VFTNNRLHFGAFRVSAFAQTMIKKLLLSAPKAFNFSLYIYF